ncbi:MAG: hypothetical protein NTZ35_01905 [Ignavibacteriales bacterium]|nr:hypothetical protein [Ignavibacteriales bacterium]
MSLECIGYHGTTPDVAENIKRDGYVLSDENSWLGKGVYFFGDYHNLTNGEEEAKYWLINVKNESEWVVFKAQIGSEKYIDLLENAEHRERFRKIQRELINKSFGAGQHNKYKDNLVFKLLQEETELEVVRAIVDAAKVSYQVIIRFQVQICVKNLTCIKSNSVSSQSRN